MGQKNSKKKGKKKQGKRVQSEFSKLVSYCLTLSRKSGRSRIRFTLQEKERIAVRKLFADFDASEIRSNYDKISRHPLFRNLASPTLKSPAHTFNMTIASRNLKQDVVWCSLILRQNASVVNRAIEVEAIALEHILRGEGNLALESLSGLSSECGFTLWGEIAKSSVCTLGLAIEEETYRDQLIHSVSENKLLTYLIQNSCGHYQDEDIFLSATRLDRKVIDRLGSKLFSELAGFHTLPREIGKNQSYQHIFATNRSGGLIDVFKTILWVIRDAVAGVDVEGDILNDCAREAVSILWGEIEHPIISNAAVVYGLTHSNINEGPLDKVHLENMYAEGYFEEIVEEADRIGILNLPFDTFEIAVRSDIRLNRLSFADSSLLQKISDNMKSVILRNAGYTNAYRFLSFLTHTLRFSDWFVQLGLFLAKEGEFVSKVQMLSIEKSLALGEFGESLNKIQLYRDEYIEKLYESHGNKNAVILAHALSNNLEEVRFNLNASPLSLSMQKIKHQITMGKYQEVIENLHMIIDAKKDPVIEIEAKRLLMICLTQLNRHSESLSILVRDSLQSVSNASIYDIESVVRSSLPNFTTSASIDFPIALSVYSRVKSSDLDSELKYSFEVFLRENEIKFPQQLFGEEGRFGEGKLHYFLQWVCTQDVMSLYLAFTSSDQIEQCRVDVCDYLIRNSKNTSRTLVNELKAINKKRAEKLAAKEVDKTRIYVDTSVFLGRDSEQFRVLFERYQKYSSVDSSEQEDERAFKDVIIRIKNSEELEIYPLPSLLSRIHLPDVALNKKNSTFLGLAKLFREEFTYGDRGINNHLSSRIRHGVLPTNIRKPLVDEGLFVSQKIRNSKSTADGWVVGAVSLSRDTERKALEKLSSFSQKIEEHIELINDSWLQIKTYDSDVSALRNINDEHDGMFDFSLSPVESYAVQGDLPLSPDYSDLVDVMVGWLWTKTNYSLANIRHRLRADSQVLMLDELERLKTDMKNSLSSDHLKGEVCNAIDRSKSKVPAQIELICSWFTRSDVIEEGGSHLISTAIDIAGKSLSLNVQIEEQDVCKVTNRSFSYMVDVFHILFENALSKSGIERDELELLVTTEKTNNQIHIRVENRCSSESSGSSDLGFYEEAYGDEQLIRDSIQKEGGTGFFKIWKILSKDIGTGNDIKLSYGKGTFRVVLIVDESSDIFLI